MDSIALISALFFTACSLIVTLYALAFLKACLSEMRRVYEKQSDTTFLKASSNSAAEFMQNRIAAENGIYSKEHRPLANNIEEDAAIEATEHAIELTKNGIPLDQAIEIAKERIKKAEMGPAPPIGGRPIADDE